jgi:hypothetical protein
MQNQDSRDGFGRLHPVVMLRQRGPALVLERMRRAARSVEANAGTIIMNDRAMNHYQY